MEKIDIAKVKLTGEILDIPKDVSSFSCSGKNPVIFRLRIYVHKPGCYLTTYLYCRASRRAFKKLNYGDKVTIYGELGDSIRIGYTKWNPEYRELIDCKRIIKIKE